MFENYFSTHVAMDWALYIVIAGGVLLAGYWRHGTTVPRRELQTTK